MVICGQREWHYLLTLSRGHKFLKREKYVFIVASCICIYGLLFLSSIRKPVELDRSFQSFRSRINGDERPNSRLCGTPFIGHKPRFWSKIGRYNLVPRNSSMYRQEREISHDFVVPGGEFLPVGRLAQQPQGWLVESTILSE